MLFKSCLKSFVLNFIVKNSRKLYTPKKTCLNSILIGYQLCLIDKLLNRLLDIQLIVSDECHCYK